MADEPNPTDPTEVVPPEEPTAPHSMWQPTVAAPTQAGWVNMPTHRPLEPNDPQEVGGYRLRARLGEGGMGRVYLSYTPGGRPVAIKVVRAEYADDPAFRRRFAQEVATAQRVQGLYTAPVIDAGPDAPHPWLATAYVPGPSLQYAVGTYGPLPAESVLVLVAGMAEALQTVHAAGVIHRDLKPSNVILAADGPRVIDFGIARAVDSTSMTQTGLRMGTPAFMSPEQIRGQPITPAADVFSLGVLAAYAATGELPFGGGLDPAVPYRILEQEPNLTGISDAVRGVVLRCLDKDPDKRPDPAGVIELCREASSGTRLEMGEGWLPPKVAAEVNRIAAAPPPPQTPPAEQVRPAGPKRRAAMTRVLVVAAVVAVLAAAGVVTAVATGLFEDENQGGSANPPGGTSTQRQEAPRTTTSRAAETTTTTPAESGPGSVAGEYPTIDIARGYGIDLNQPARATESGDDLLYPTYGQLQTPHRTVVLDANQPANYQTCITETQYESDGSAIGRLQPDEAFCVLAPGRVALVQIKKVPDTTSSTYQISLTLWQGPAT